MYVGLIPSLLLFLALLADDRRAFRHQAIMDDVAVRERKAKAMRARAKLAG